jgi:hypothetical protein
MKKNISLIAFLCMPLMLSSQNLSAAESPVGPSATTVEPSKVQMKEPFQRMTPGEMASTGIQKLSPTEQDALATWWNQHKTSSHQHHITKEVSITSIANEGKNVVLSDGSKISFSSSVRKKVSRWALGDKLGLGEAGKRGSVTVYHIASGQKVKAKREQAPQTPTASDQK